MIWNFSRSQLKVFSFVLSYDKILHHRKVLTTTHPINERQKNPQINITELQHTTKLRTKNRKNIVNTHLSAEHQIYILLENFQKKRKSKRIKLNFYSKIFSHPSLQISVAVGKSLPHWSTAQATLRLTSSLPERNNSTRRGRPPSARNCQSKWGRKQCKPLLVISYITRPKYKR